MTILEELIDAALGVCENSRAAGQKHHSRGAALLTKDGRVYTGCDVYMPDTIGAVGISAERAAVLAAVADGASNFDCIVVGSDTMKAHPSPDGLSREFLRTFGIFPVILVNCDMDVQHTSTQELFPREVEANSFVSSQALDRAIESDMDRLNASLRTSSSHKHTSLMSELEDHDPDLEVKVRSISEGQPFCLYVSKLTSLHLAFSSSRDGDPSRSMIGFCKSVLGIFLTDISNVSK
jgi:cytidine deaminase